MKLILPVLLVLCQFLTYTTALSMLDVAGQCADTSGFNSCWSTALSNAQSCYQKNCQGEGTCTSETDCTSSNADCVQICSCQAYSEMINCALTSCWNMVFGCEYQNLAINAVEYCPLAFGKPSANPWIGTGTGWVWVPYFPSNPNRPSACSCNIAYVYLEQYESLQEHTNCYNNYAKGTTSILEICDCCRATLGVSAFYNMCPSTDPAAIMPTMPYFPYNVVAGNAQCASLISGNDCHNYGYDLPNFNTSLTTTYYSEGDLPANGTNGISNNPGSVTSPLYPTLTWQLGAGMQTQTAIAVTTGSAAGGASASASGNGGASSAAATSGSGGTATGNGGTATGSGATTNSATASASTATSKSGAVSSREGNVLLVWCLTLAATIAILV